MFQLLSPRLWLVLLWGIIIACSLSVRPLFPIDETRYVAVAWDMWLRDDFLVPHLNGETYSHKPPLLFWLMQLSWWLFGVNDWSHRLIAPLFSLATLYLSGAIAKLLWPDRKGVAALTPFILLGFFIWLIYSTLTMFDIMLSFFALLGMYSLWILAHAGLSLKRWGLLGIAIGGGVLTKGPVILLHILPAAILAPWWLVDHKQTHFRWLHWYGGLVLAILIGAALALCWAVPAGISGGETYRNAIFLGQTSGRLVNSFAHKLPWWWYLQILPLVLLPWPLMKPFWTGLPSLNLKENCIRFCVAWVVPVFIAFSLVSGKRIHYLLPLAPALALLLASTFDQQADSTLWQRSHRVIATILGLIGLILATLPWLNDQFLWRKDLPSISPVWGVLLFICAFILATVKAKNAQESVFNVCLVSISAILIVSCGYFVHTAARYDTSATATKIAELMDADQTIAIYTNKYHGQYHFTGRLKKPIIVISNFPELLNFAATQKTCHILVTYDNSNRLPESMIANHYPLKSKNIGVLPCKTLIEHPELEKAFIP